jgi:hypothetical protein
MMRVCPVHRWQQRRPAEDVPDLESETRSLRVQWRTDGAIRAAPRPPGYQDLPNIQRSSNQEVG